MGKRGMVFRGNVYYADLSPVVGSEQGGTRPVLVIQNDTGNKYSPTVICSPITSKINKTNLPTHLLLKKEEYGFLDSDSIVMLEQVRTIDKSRLKEFVGMLSPNDMSNANSCLKISLDL